MTVIKRENVVMVDVDDTLVMHVDCCYHQPNPRYYRIEVKDPLGGPPILVRINHPMVRLLKEEHNRGSFIIVWSRGGYEWAANVIEALKLSEYVGYVMSKPLAYFDDKPVQEWLSHRVYIGPDEVYKNKG